MQRVGDELRTALAACLLAACGAAGCAQIPAIDPTGQHLFAGTTGLAHHGHGHGLFHKHRDAAPAAVAPVVTAPVATVPVAPVKPPCSPPIQVVPIAPVVPAPQPLVAVPLAPAAPVIPVAPVACGPQQMTPHVLPGKPQAGGPLCEAGAGMTPPGPELRVTPARIVAPVGTEVVVAAGLCAPSGYYVMRQPLEWMLAQDGVGQIVAVGHESPHNVSFLLRNSPQKVATNYARAHTSTIQQTLDRGTPNPADDVFLEKGQSWITVSSPTEGTSHITVWAPKEHQWERRKAFATIFWVDAAWKFPPGVTTRAGNRQVLQTVVTRSGGQPVSGWIVRYQVLGGPPAAFGVGGERSISVTTDGAGRATVELLPLATQPGITMVGIQVIRPGTARGDLPEMIVGQGTTSVQWTTPGLSVRAIGTSTVAADGAVSYRVEVTNNGDLSTRGVAVSYDPPPGVSILNTAPPAQVFGQRYEWRLGDLPPRTTSVIELNCRAAVAASIRSTFRATSAGGLSVEGGTATEVFHNALSVQMTGPETAEVGREAKFLIEVTNTGDAPLTNVVATDTFEPGLQERHGANSPAVKTLTPSLGPGETHRFALTFVVAEPGRHCHRLRVTADGGHTAATQGCLTATAPIATPPQLAVRVSGPRSVRPGEIADCTVEVVNSGTGPATNVVLLVHTATSLELDRATPGFDYDPARGVTEWRIARLAGGERLTRQLQFKTVAPDEAALVRATVASEQTATVAGETSVRIASLDGSSPYDAAPPQRSAGDESMADAELRIAIAETADPVRQGDTMTYIVTIVNDRDAPDRDVTIQVEVTGGFRIVRIPSSPTAAVRSDERSVEFAPIREVRAGEQLPPFRIEVRGTQPGRHKLQVKVTSSASPEGIAAEAETTVAAP